MERRQIVFSGAAFLMAAAAAPVTFADSEGPVSAAARALYSKAVVLDGNLAPPLDDSAPVISKASLDLVRNSGITTMKTTLGGFNQGFEDTVGQIAMIQQMIEFYPDVFLQVRELADI